MSDSQATYRLPVVLEYFKTVTEPPKSRKSRKKGDHRRDPPEEGFRILYISDCEENENNGDSTKSLAERRRIHLGTIKLEHGSDSILSLLIQLSQRCGVLTHRCQIVLEQQYVSAQEEDMIEMLNETKRQSSDQNESEPIVEEVGDIQYAADVDSDQNGSNDRSMDNEDSDNRVGASDIIRALLRKHPAVEQWLRTKPRWHHGVLVNDNLAEELMDRLIQQQADWRQVIQQIVEDIRAKRQRPTSSSINNQPESGREQCSITESTTRCEENTNEIVDFIIRELIRSVTKDETEIIDDVLTTETNGPPHSEIDNTSGGKIISHPTDQCTEHNGHSEQSVEYPEPQTSEMVVDEYTGSDEFVSGLLLVTVYLSRDVFVKRNILRSMKHIKAFDALLDVLEDGHEVLGLTEGFPLPINDRQLHKQHIQSFETWLLYERLRPKWEAMCNANPDGMTATLWDYQRRAVQWMLQREGDARMVPNLLWRKVICHREDHESSASKSKQFWFHIDDGGFWEGSGIDAVHDVRGGILADQMGLGKTVECLALILLNPQRYWSYGKPVGDDRYRMFRDEDDEEDEELNHNGSHQEKYGEPDAESIAQFMNGEQLLCESRATLIVLPTNILHQWKSEIQTHAPHLNVYIYLGLNGWKKQRDRIRKRKRKLERKRRSSGLYTSSGMSASKSPRKRRRLNSNGEAGLMEGLDDDIDADGVSTQIHDDDDDEEPNYQKLAKYDVVLTDYAVLRAESNYSTPLNYRFRRKKRYEIPNTPLLQIRWWRLILDEAQQIESRVSQSARMALKLTTKYRWAVTGTPIGKNGLDDLYGLVKFLGVEPFNTQVAWLRTVAEPYYNGDDRRLFAILKRIMWRQAKHHVADELVL